MKTIFYSELLNKQFDSEKECLAAETAYKKQKAEKEKADKALKENRAADAHAIQEAYKAYVDAYNKYIGLRNDFVEKYGSFHMTFNSAKELPFEAPFNFNDVDRIVRLLMN